MKISLVSILLFGFSFIASAQPKDTGYINMQLDSLISQQMDASDPGGAVAVVSGDKILYHKTFGMMSLEYGLPNNNRTLFNLASVSKHFTAFAILLLEKEGKLNLNDDIRLYLPNLPEYKQVVTINHLIHHTSGIPSSDNLRLFAGVPFEAPWDADDEMNIISRYHQLNYTPNSEGNYSNSGYFLLAKIIEQVSGETFSDYLTENIFEPLGMKETFVYDSPGKIIPARATGYKKAGNSYIRMNTDGESVYGSTNLYTSINDISIWMQNLLNPKVGDQEMMKKLFQPSHVLNNGYITNYTYGLNIRRYKGIKTADHGGYAMGFRSQIMVFPENNLAIISMSNNESIDNWTLATKVANWYLVDHFVPERKSERKEIKLPGNVLQNYAGIYKMTNGMELSFEVSNDTFLVSMPGEPKKYIVRAESETEFFVDGYNARCSFEMGSNGECEELTWNQNNRKPKGIKVSDSGLLTTAELRKYAGNYFNDPLDITYPVILRENKLAMVLPKSFKTFYGIDREIELEYSGKDRFLTQTLGLIQFTRDKSGLINGFRIVDFGRVKNIEFKKKK